MTSATDLDARPELDVLTTETLSAVQEIFDTYIVFPSEEARDATVLWALHTHVFDEFESTPRLSIRSNEPASGKSRVMEVLTYIVRRPLDAVYMTPGVMWRSIEHGAPTILLDEVDTIFGKNGSGSAHRYLRGIINAGHRSTGKVPRCVGSEDVKDFAVFSPVAMAGIGRLPETIATRSVEIIMRRRKAGDHEVQPFRLKYACDKLRRAKRLCEQWADKAAFELRLAMPELPVQDRKADVWEPLIAIADLAYDDWAKRARQAAIVLTEEASKEPPSIGVQLLTDIRTVFDDKQSMFTHELLGALHSMGDRPWTPRNLDPRRLARLLSEHGIEPGMLRRGDKTARGYRRDDFEQPWSWYIDEM